MRIRNVVALDWSDECHGIKVRVPGGVFLLGDHETMDAVSEREVDSMTVEGGYLVITVCGRRASRRMCCAPGTLYTASYTANRRDVRIFQRHP